MFDDFDSDRFSGSGGRGRQKKYDEDESQAYVSEKAAPRAFKNLSEIDLDKELTDQIAEATSLRDWVLQNVGAFQVNHVTDTLKTVNSLIANAVKMKEQVQNMARMKAFEDAVVETMKEAPAEVKAKFFENLQEKLK